MNSINYKRKLIYVCIESVFAYGSFGIAIPVMTIFWNSIGMNQALIGISQAACSIAVLLFNVPMGYLADKYNRKLLNILGDFGLALAFIFYMFAQHFIEIIILESICGIFLAMTNGVDRSFLKFYSYKIDNSGKLFEKNSVKLQTYQFIGLVVAIIIGMIISKYSVKLCLGALAIPFFISGIAAMFIDDIGEKISKENSSNMIADIKHILKNKKNQIMMLAYGLANESCHPIIWVLTPILILVGVPTYIVGIGWLLNYITPILGAYLAKKMTSYKFENKFIIPFIFIILGTVPIIICPNIWTVWLFALTGFANGISSTLLLPEIQKGNEDKYQTTIVSMATTITRLIYIPIVWLINAFANSKPQVALIANLAFFLPLACATYFVLKKSIK